MSVEEKLDTVSEHIKNAKAWMSINNTKVAVESMVCARDILNSMINVIEVNTK